MITTAEFNKKIKAWLPKPEYSEVYRINHPSENREEVHFIHKGVRVCCVKHFKDNYFYLNTEVFLIGKRVVLTLKTSKYDLFSPTSTKRLDRLMVVMLENKRKLLKQSFWSKFLRLLNR